MGADALVHRRHLTRTTPWEHMHFFIGKGIFQDGCDKDMRKNSGAPPGKELTSVEF